jgi:glutamate dehydrogenase/leucine dehydrogenase
MQGKRVAVSGSGNVAVYTVEKLIELGAIPLTMSDSTGYIYEPEGITTEILEYVNKLKVIGRGRLSDYKSPSGKGEPAVSACPSAPFSMSPRSLCVSERWSVCM